MTLHLGFSLLMRYRLKTVEPRLFLPKVREAN